jgi:hypothetical protein
MITVLFSLTAVLSLFLSNTASAVLVAPIAIFAAEALNVSPYPFAVAVLISASAAFIQQQYCRYFPRDAIGEANLASLPKTYQPSERGI